MSGLDARLLAALRGIERLVVFTGAGVSAESGVPTFRDPQSGLWARFDAAELATPEAFERDAARVWAWYEWRRASVRAAQPNAAHRAIAALAERVPHLTLITQNVDDLHERAGSRDVVHLHGELSRPRCATCGRPHRFPEGAPQVPADGLLEPPRCAACGGRIRPGVVWFGERLPERPWQRAREATRQAELFLCCGSSLVVQPAASLVDLAVDSGAFTLQVDPQLTGREDELTVAIRGPAGEVLPRLVAEAWPDAAPRAGEDRPR